MILAIKNAKTEFDFYSAEDEPPHKTYDDVHVTPKINELIKNNSLFSDFEKYYERSAEGGTEAIRTFMELSVQATEAQKAMAAYSTVTSDAIEKESSAYDNAMETLKDYTGQSEEFISENLETVHKLISEDIEMYEQSILLLQQVLSDLGLLDLDGNVDSQLVAIAGGESLVSTESIRSIAN